MTAAARAPELRREVRSSLLVLFAGAGLMAVSALLSWRWITFVAGVLFVIVGCAFALYGVALALRATWTSTTVGRQFACLGAVAILLLGGAGACACGARPRLVLFMSACIPVTRARLDRRPLRRRAIPLILASRLHGVALVS